VIPIVTPEEMASVDRAAPEPTEVLVERAGYHVAVAARRILSGSYGKRIMVVAGPGNNGADGKSAARNLARWGASVAVVDATTLGPRHRLAGGRPADLIIDAAFGTGLSRPYTPPDPDGTPVLAVDIPSGLSGLTGEGEAMTAVGTVTFEALKPGLLLGAGPDRSGAVEVPAIGLGELVGRVATMWAVTDEDVALHLPRRGRLDHKWKTAVAVFAGSPAMNGAPLMVAHSATRAGAGYALVGVPGNEDGGGLPPGEQVGLPLPAGDWPEAADRAAARVKAIVVGPGLGAAARGAAPGGGDAQAGTGKDTPVGRLLRGENARGVPAVVDADGLTALGDLAAIGEVVDCRTAPTVLTPHDGEYRRITGHDPAADRIADVRGTAGQTGAVVLLKGSPTIVAAPDGRVMVITAGSPRLATAGTGDVLSGAIAAFLARGLDGLEAAALAAHAHGRAASRGPAEGLVAGDLPPLVSQWLSELER
jgi:ADP-dependent NAD(P)H-hydrate dehydratase / NAD(P)H-hydrate epimerase